MLRPGSSGVQAVSREPSPESIWFGSTEATSAQPELLLFNRSSIFCSTEATSVSQSKVY